MKLLNRTQFINHWNSIHPSLGEPDSGLWAWEDYYNKCSQWFVCVKPLPYTCIEELNQWCVDNCKEHVTCYCSDWENSEEWWGFGNADDIIGWILKWA